MSSVDDTDPVESAPRGGAVDPALLRLIQRVAHREHLLDGSHQAPRVRTTVVRSSARRRPAVGSARTTTPVRATRGTTARKVTWS